jgi:AP-4 complex subunit epsilon-1
MHSPKHPTTPPLHPQGSNVEVIVERMLGYLRFVSDDHIRRDITRKVGTTQESSGRRTEICGACRANMHNRQLQVAELAERYAPSPSWFIRVVSEVLQLGGDHLEAGVAHALCRLVAEQDAVLHRWGISKGGHCPTPIMYCQYG